MTEPRPVLAAGDFPDPARHAADRAAREIDRGADRSDAALPVRVSAALAT